MKKRLYAFTAVLLSAMILVAIAVGIVCCEENPDVNFEDIEKFADKRMYENKSAS